MENQLISTVVEFDKFTWTIKNFSELNSEKLYSETFFIGGHPWRILMFPKGNNVNYLSIYLDAVDTGLPHGWSRIAKFKLALINKFNSKMTITKETEHHFNAKESAWGFKNFIPLVELCSPGRGFIVDDTCMIEVEISVSKSEHENLGDQPAKTTVVSPVSAQVKVEPMGELMDFKGLGKIQKDFVPLLEEVCERHPSLIECQQNRTPRFIEWAFTALGRILHFLKTKKVKDMNDDACMHLQILWEELETFRFDLTWLEPHVQSALGMKSYMERAVQVKKKKENVAASERKIERLKVDIAAAEVDLDTARRDLVKAEEGFEEKDLDVELGYGK